MIFYGGLNHHNFASKNKMEIYPILNNLQNAAGQNKCCGSQTFKFDKKTHILPILNLEMHFQKGLHFYILYVSFV